MADPAVVRRPTGSEAHVDDREIELLAHWPHVILLEIPGDLQCVAEVGGVRIILLIATLDAVENALIRELRHQTQGCLHIRSRALRYVRIELRSSRCRDLSPCTVGPHVAHGLRTIAEILQTKVVD